MRAVFMVKPDEASGGTMYRMADVVDAPAIAVAPRVRDSHGPCVVAEKITAEFPTRLVLKGQPG